MTENWIKSDLAGGAGASNLVFNEKIKKLRVSLCVEALFATRMDITLAFLSSCF